MTLKDHRPMTADDGKKDSRPLTAENRPQIRKGVFVGIGRVRRDKDHGRRTDDRRSDKKGRSDQ